MRKLIVLVCACLLVLGMTSIGFASILDEEENEIVKRHREWMEKRIHAQQKEDPEDPFSKLEGPLQEPDKEDPEDPFSKIEGPMTPPEPGNLGNDVIATPKEEVDPAYGAEIAAGWLAEELGIKENKIICTGYKDLDAPVTYGGITRITDSVSRYAFYFKIKREPDIEYIVIGAWNLSVPPDEQGWIKIGETIVGHTIGHTTADPATGGTNEEPILEELGQRKDVEAEIENNGMNGNVCPHMADEQKELIPLTE